MRNVTILAVVAMLALAVPAYGTVYWDGGAGTDSYHDPLNWTTDALPVSGDQVTPNDGSTVVISQPIVETNLRLRNAAGATWLLEAGGVIQDQSDVFVGYYGGSWPYPIASYYTQTGGTLSNTIVQIGWAGRIGVATISGGSLDTGDGRLHVHQVAKGNYSELNIIGTGATLIKTDNFAINNTASVLNIELDASGAVTPIQAVNATTLLGTLTVNDDLATGLLPGDTVTVLTTTGSLDYSVLQFSDPAWTMSTGGSDVALTYVPEPATLTLLGIGLVGVVLRRKRR